MTASFQAPDAPGVTLTINGVPLARAARCLTRAGQALRAVLPLGSREPAALLPGALSYTVELSRLLWEAEPADFYTLSNFTLDITENGRVFRYSGCHWSRIEQAEDRALLWEKAVVEAPHREEVTV